MADEAGLSVRRPEKTGRPRLLYRAIEDLLHALPLASDLEDLAAQILAHPGINLRNRVGHAYLEHESCDEMLAGLVLYLLCAFAFVGLSPLTAGDDATAA